MSLTYALGSATSSLQAIQTRLGVASSNIANSDTAGYTVKSATVTTRVTAGTGSGVTVAAIASKVDANLLQSIVAATSANGKASTLASVLEQLGGAMGALSSDDDGGDTLASSLSDLLSALEELATTPESGTLKGQVVLALDDTATKLRQTSSDVQGLRQKADAGIETSIQSINQLLVSIDEFNETIARAQSSGQPTADLEDQRMEAVRDLATHMDISYFSDSTGAVRVYTSTGQPLVTSQIHLLSHDAAGTVTSQSDYPNGFDGIWLNGVDITASLKSGALAALVELRDSTLPAVQTDLDGIATTLMDTVNGLANSGTAAPAPTTLTGTVTGFTGTDALTLSGTLRVVVADADGLTVSAADIDLTTVTSVDDLLADLNAVSGLSATLNGDGQLVITATDPATGIALSGGEVSAIFGLNDLLTGSGAEDIDIRAALIDDPTLLPSGTLSDATTLTAGDAAITAGSGALAQAMADAVTAAGLTDAAGTLVADVGELLAQAQSQATNKETALTALTDAFSSRYGVNIDEETARISELENAYAASAQVLTAVQEMFDTLLQAVR